MRNFSCLLVFCMLFGVCGVMVSCQGSGTTAQSTVKDTSDNTSDTADTTDTSDTPDTTKPVNTEKKAIDIYIIAGQSNASGYSNVTSAAKSVLSSFWSEYENGVQGVIYSGRAESTVGTATTAVNEYKTWTPVKVGMGALANSDGYSHIGPELGMAAALSEYYRGEENGKTAGIIKYAHGGTSLLNNTVGENAANGNWVSPSYAQFLGISYSGLTGGLYRNLLTQVKNSCVRLSRAGYEEINIKGIFWMQGEADRANPAEYKKALKFFISDIRRDLGKELGKDLSDLPFIIGEISRTSGSADSATVSMNKSFIAKQREIAREVPNTYIVSSSKYDVNTFVNGTSVQVQDGWHWCTADMLKIGKEVGECIIKNILS